MTETGRASQDFAGYSERERLRLIAARENERISDLVRGVMDRPGGILAFQRDAYEGVRSKSTRRIRLHLLGVADFWGKLAMGRMSCWLARLQQGS